MNATRYIFTPKGAERVLRQQVCGSMHRREKYEDLVMTSDEALGILQGCKALLRDTHVVYTSGRHGNAYINALHPWRTVLQLLRDLRASLRHRH